MCDLTFLFFYEFILVERLHRKKVLNFNSALGLAQFCRLYN